MGQRIDLTGQTFGKWTVLHFSHSSAAGSAYWECGCECGARSAVAANNLRRGRSLGCRECSYAQRRQNLTGETFGKWTVLERTGKGSGGNTMWKCRCACGTEREIPHQNLTQGYSTQCLSCAARNRKGK